MPRDTTALVEATPDLSTPSLEGLAWLLRHKEAWPRGFVWDYNCCDQCAAGIAALLWKECAFRTSVNWVSEVAAMWSMPLVYGGLGSARYIFANPGHGRLSDITPEVVASRIEEHLEAHQRRK